MTLMTIKRMVLAATAAAVLPAYGQGNAADVPAQIERTIGALAAEWPKHDAPAIAARFFTSNATLIGEGGKEMSHTPAQLKGVLQELFKMAPAARLEVRMAKALGPDAAYGWVVWHCNPDKPASEQFTVRSLYVFQREAGQWKIAADSYSMGDLTLK